MAHIARGSDAGRWGAHGRSDAVAAGVVAKPLARSCFARALLGGAAGLPAHVVLAAAVAALFLAAPVVAQQEQAKDLTCDELPVWRDAKATAVRLALSVNPSVANETWGQPELTEAMDTGLLLLPLAATNPCMLGSRTYIQVALLVTQLGLPPYEMDFFDRSTFPWAFSDVIYSGWPVFGLAAAYKQKRYPTYQEAWKYMPGCRALGLRAEGFAGSRPLLHPENFTDFLWYHLQLRPPRRQIPREPIKAFIAFAAKPPPGGDLCQLAVATAELALAVALLCSSGGGHQAGAARRGPAVNSTISALRLVRRAEERIRGWWHVTWTELKPATEKVTEDVVGWNLDVQLHLLVRWPVFELLQALQDQLYYEDHVVVPSVGIGVDHNPAAHIAELEQKGPEYWQERRELLRAAVYGPAKSWLDGPQGPPKPTVYSHGQSFLTQRGGAPLDTSNVLVLTWDLNGRMNATALVSRCHTQPPRGLVILHNGHDGRTNNLEERPDPYGLSNFMVGLGFDVITLCMPFTGYNHLGKDNPGGYHDTFHEYYAKGDKGTLAYFVAPVRLALDWAEQELGHKRFAMVGFSGGGWTTYLAAALEPRISLSVAALATLPPHLVDNFDWTRYDYELRYYPHEAYNDCPMLCWFVLAVVAGAAGGQRWGVHLFHMAEDLPYPTPNAAAGLERELEEYYDVLLPRVIAAALGRRPDEVARKPAPLRLALTTTALLHMGAWRDTAMLEALLRRWGALASREGGRRAEDAGVFPPEWPTAIDARRDRPDFAAGAAAGL